MLLINESFISIKYIKTWLQFESAKRKKVGKSSCSWGFKKKIKNIECKTKKSERLIW